MLLVLSAPLTLLLLTFAYAAGSVQSDWVFPQVPDYSTTIQLGEEYQIQWTSALQGWLQSYCPDCNTASVDLWVTSSNRNDKQYKVASSVDVTSSLSVAWTATVSLSDSRTWVFRFLPSGQDPSSTSEEISSSIFLISDPDAASTLSTTTPSPTTSSTEPVSTSSPSPASTDSTSLASTSSAPPVSVSSNSPSSTNPTMTTSAAAATETMTAPQSSSGLSTGTKAGIGVGAGVGAIALIALGWFLARYHESKSSTPGPGGSENRNLGKSPHELDGAISQTAYAGPSTQAYYQHPAEAGVGGDGDAARNMVGVIQRLESHLYLSACRHSQSRHGRRSTVDAFRTAVPSTVVHLDMTDQTQNATGTTPVSRPASRIVSRDAEALLEAKVQQAVEAVQSGQYKSIKAAASAFKSPYKRTLSRFKGHHSRGQNGRPAVIIGGDLAAGVSARTARRRKQRARLAMANNSSSLDAVAAVRPAAATRPAVIVGGERRRSLTSQATPQESASQLSTHDLLRELCKRFEMTASAHIDSLRQSLTAEITLNLSTHFARQAEQIDRLQKDISHLQASLAKAPSEE
ncbi:hypothetical protein O1611_g913 [Lasiodiplodia mahajangana]|uniref:Uncharacterized protein n=1 Tax=Lasiodiplodia mahajangana TaxID=1108764 RepID=A0ACC2JZI4_9PEZI|nr:hypothetical protein O1611_g913 [Lasiodiplodia mahajangana]